MYQLKIDMDYKGGNGGGGVGRRVALCTKALDCHRGALDEKMCIRVRACAHGYSKPPLRGYVDAAPQLLGLRQKNWQTLVKVGRGRSE